MAVSAQSADYPKPRLRVASEGASDCADIVAETAARAGMRLLPWQYDMVADWSAMDEFGKFVHGRAGGSIPRQAGKTTALIAWIATLAISGYRVLYTAHNYSTTCEILRRIRDVFGRKVHDRDARYPEFNDLVSAVNNSTAQESIELFGGGVIAFSTRTKTATLGYSFDVIVYDEAQELTDEHQQAILPTFTSGAKHNPQSLYFGTPVRPGSPAEVFKRVRNDAWAGGRAAEGLSWWEYGVEEVGDIHDEGRWFDVNPSLGPVSAIEAIRIAVSSMDDLAFAQEFLGYWLPDGESDLPEVSRDDWAALAVPNPPTEGKIVFGIKFSPDGETAAIAACRRPAGGLPHIEVVAYRSMASGMAFFEDFAQERCKSASGFVIDGGGNAHDLIERLEAAKLPKRAVEAPTSAEVASACAGLLNAVADGTMTHFGQPALDECMAHIKKRTIGQRGFGFAGFGGCDPTMAEAAALALWGITAIKRDPNRKARIL